MGVNTLSQERQRFSNVISNTITPEERSNLNFAEDLDSVVGQFVYDDMMRNYAMQRQNGGTVGGLGVNQYNTDTSNIDLNDLDNEINEALVGFDRSSVDTSNIDINTLQAEIRRALRDIEMDELNAEIGRALAE